MGSVGEEYPKEQARCRELLGEYQAIGPAGSFGYAAISAVLKRAEEAAISGDPVAILRAFKEMKECA